MKRQIRIPKSRLYAAYDYASIIASCASGGDSNELNYRELEAMRIKSGRVCVFDAYKKASTRPLFQKFEHAVAIPFYITQASIDGSRRLAFSGLRFLKEQPIYFKLALYDEKDVIKLLSSSPTPISTNVESGFLGFADYLTHAEFIASLIGKDDHPLDEIVSFEGDTAILKKLSDNQNMAIFSSGLGEGEYPCYIGYTAKDLPCILLCDFLILQNVAPLRVTGVEHFEFDIELEQLYQDDSALSDDENAVAKWSFVLAQEAELDEFICYRALARRAHAYHNMRRHSDALVDYYNAIELSKMLPPAKLAQVRVWSLYDNAGQLNRELGNLTEAKRLFLLGKNFGDSFYSGAHVNLVEIYLIEKSYELALEMANQMIDSKSSDPLSYIKRAEVFVALGEYESAILDYDILINRFNWEEAILEKTSALGKLKRYEEALATLEKYAQVADPNEHYYYNKGYLEYKLAKYDVAYESLLLATDYNPAYTPPIRLLLEIDEMLFDYARVVSWATKYIDLKPNTQFGYAMRAEGYKNNGDFTSALGDYKHLYNDVTQDPLYAKHIVCTALLAKNFKLAKRYLKLLKKERSGWYSLALAHLLEKKGKTIKAMRVMDAAVLDTQNEHILSSSLDFYTRSKNVTKAAEILNLIRDSSSSYAIVIKEYNFALSFCGVKKAEQVLEEYVAKVLNNSLTRCTSDDIKQRIKSTAKICSC